MADSHEPIFSNGVADGAAAHDSPAGDTSPREGAAEAASSTTNQSGRERQQPAAADDSSAAAAASLEAEADGDGDGDHEASLRELIFDRSPNVWRTMLFTFLINLAGAVWQGSVWSPLMQSVFHSNIYLGIIAAAGGVGELSAAVLSGWGADRFGKEIFLRIAAVVGILAVAAIAVGVHFEHLATLIVANAASGASYGAFFPCVEGIFADSVPPGKRSFLYNVKYALETVSYVAGYCVTLCMFAAFGNHWHVPVMKAVVFAGLGITVVTTALLFTIREKYTLRGMRKGSAAAAAAAVAAAAADSAAASADSLARGLINDGAAAGGAEDAAAADDDDDESEDGYVDDDDDDDEEDFTAHPALTRAPGLVPQRFLPFVVAAKDLVVCLGSGMTVMYISLFLIDDFGVAPMQLQGVLVGCSAFSVVCSTTIGAVVGDSGRCATDDGRPRFNRIRMMLVPLGVGVFGIFYLALATGSFFTGIAPTLVVYIVRAGAMNSMSGLSRAVLMDLVPAKNRAKWNVFESVSSVTWAGSAIVGGAIADKYNYRATFLITALCHAAGFLVIVVGCFNRDRPPKEVVAEILKADEARGETPANSRESVE